MCVFLLCAFLYGCNGRKGKTGREGGAPLLPYFLCTPVPKPLRRQEVGGTSEQKEKEEGNNGGKRCIKWTGREMEGGMTEKEVIKVVE